MKKSRYSLIAGFFLFFWIASLTVRTALLVWSFSKADLTFSDITALYLKGFVFDTAVAVFFSLPYAIYFLVLPQRLFPTAWNRWITYIGFFLMFIITLFSFFAEFVFWNEFESRFNYMATDYLIYPYEIVHNINQSYPMPVLVTALLLLTAGMMFLFYKLKLFQRSFESNTSLAKRITISGSLITAGVLFALFLSTSFAETSMNRYRNELSQAGIFSFFAAFKNHKLDYYAFYRTEKEAKIFTVLRGELSEPNAEFLSDACSIRRIIHSSDSLPPKPNVMLICVESLDANFMAYFGNTQNLTPHIDSLARNSILFTHLYATGTRTVRGMEALTLLFPPTPGNSILRRSNNHQLFNISSVFKAKGYESTFIYGGDGYFDNMNVFFGNNGFDIMDRERKMNLNEKFTGKYITIPNSQVRFENAWGICDEDLYRAVICDADEKYNKACPFFQFVMTTSNHPPYTYPDGKIDIPSGSGRNGALKYTDYAFGQFIHQIREKPWFENTVMIVIADHCASTVGKNEINVSEYHIPCLIYNLKGEPAFSVIDKQCSQIDVFPTLFALLGWTYESNFFGQNVLADHFRPRAFISTYRKLGYLQNDSLLLLSPYLKAETYRLNNDKTQLIPIPMDSSLLVHTIVCYQTASWLFNHGGMKEDYSY